VTSTKYGARITFEFLWLVYIFGGHDAIIKLN